MHACMHSRAWPQAHNGRPFERRDERRVGELPNGFFEVRRRDGAQHIKGARSVVRLFWPQANHLMSEREVRRFRHASRGGAHTLIMALASAMPSAGREVVAAVDGAAAASAMSMHVTSPKDAQ